METPTLMQLGTILDQLTQWSTDHVVRATALHLAIRTNGGHWQCGNGGGHTGQQHRNYAIEYASLCCDPWEAYEQNNSPNVEQTSHQYAFDPAKLGGGFIIISFQRRIGGVHFESFGLEQEIKKEN